jgi:hypothetical protein
MKQQIEEKLEEGFTCKTKIGAIDFDQEYDYFIREHFSRNKSKFGMLTVLLMKMKL